MAESRAITFGWIRNTAIIVAGIAAGAMATVGVVLGWLDGRYVLASAGPFETVHASEIAANGLRVEFKNDMAAVYGAIGKNSGTIGDLAGNVKASNDYYDRINAGFSSRLVEIMMDRAGARSDDCEELRQPGHKMTPFEIKTCRRFERDEAQATRRYENEQTTTTQAWRKR